MMRLPIFNQKMGNYYCQHGDNVTETRMETRL
jgi:hypothetical protein